MSSPTSAPPGCWRPKLLLLVCLLTATLALPLVCMAQASDSKDNPPQKDVLIFTNGDQMTGTLERGVGKTIVFKSDMAGELTVSLDKVRELRTRGSFAMLRKDAPVTRSSSFKPGPIGYSDGKFQATVAPGQVETVPADDLAYLIDDSTFQRELDPHPALTHGWNGSVSAGATVIRSTQVGTTLNAGVSATRVIPAVPYLPNRSRTTFNLQENYGTLRQPVTPPTSPASPDSLVRTHIFHTDLEQDHYFSPRFFTLAELSFDHNFALGLDLQQIYGLGLGWTPVQTSTQQLDLKADVHYEKQQFETAVSNGDLFGSTFSEAYRRSFPRRMILTQTASVLPAWNNLNAYSANASVTLAVPVFRRFSMNLTATDTYLNNPAIGFKKNSFQFITAIGYTFR